MSLWNFLSEFALFNMICDLFSSKPKPTYQAPQSHYVNNYDDYGALDINSTDTDALQRRIDQLERMQEKTDFMSERYDEIQDLIDTYQDQIDHLEEIESIQDEIESLQDDIDFLQDYLDDLKMDRDMDIDDDW